MPNLEIADEALRSIVNSLIANGIPPVFTPETIDLADDQMASYCELAKAAKIYNETIDKEADQREELPQPGSSWWNGCMEFRKALQTAIKAGLIRGPMVQENMVDFGAIPDPCPDSKWKYVMQPNATYICWECGSEIIGQKIGGGQFNSRKGEDMGRLPAREVPFCPVCDAT